MTMNLGPEMLGLLGSKLNADRQIDWQREPSNVNTHVVSPAVLDVVDTALSNVILFPVQSVEEDYQALPVFEHPAAGQ